MTKLRSMFRWLGILGIAAAAATTPAFAQETAAGPCEQAGACRYVEEYVIEDQAGEEHRFPVGADLPWVMQNNILLTIGETIIVRLVRQDGSLVPQLVNSGEEARSAQLTEGEIRFDYGTFDHGTVMLTVHSAFPEPLEYAALMVTINNGPERTSVCALQPGLTVFERWQVPVYQLALGNFRPTEGFACEVIEVDAAISEAEPV